MKRSTLDVSKVIEAGFVPVEGITLAQIVEAIKRGYPVRLKTTKVAHSNERAGNEVTTTHTEVQVLYINRTKAATRTVTHRAFYVDTKQQYDRYKTGSARFKSAINKNDVIAMECRTLKEKVQQLFPQCTKDGKYYNALLGYRCSRAIIAFISECKSIDGYNMLIRSLQQQYDYTECDELNLLYYAVSNLETFIDNESYEKAYASTITSVE